MFRHFTHEITYSNNKKYVLAYWQRSRLLRQWSRVRFRHLSQRITLRTGRVTVYNAKSRGREGDLPLWPKKDRKKRGNQSRKTIKSERKTMKHLQQQLFGLEILNKFCIFFTSSVNLNRIQISKRQKQAREYGTGQLDRFGSEVEHT